MKGSDSPDIACRLQEQTSGAGKKRKPIFKTWFLLYLAGMDGADNQLDFNFAADDLLEFPRDLGEGGYFQFHSEQKQAFRALEEKFGISLNRRVRLRLVGRDEEFEGKLMLESLLMPSLHDEFLRLRLGKITFKNTEIEFFKTAD